MNVDNELKLWVVPFTKEIQPITKEEEKIAKELSPQKSILFIKSRGYLRHILSLFFNIPALEIPIIALPGEPPILRNKLGEISLSHCKDALLIGWSRKKIGVDIERKDRRFFAKGLANKFYSKEEKVFLDDIDDDLYHYNVLKFWVLKESAIKWQKGTISKDLSHWEVKNNFQLLYHNNLKFKLFAFYSQFELWSIGLAYEQSMNGNINKIISKVL